MEVPLPTFTCAGIVFDLDGVLVDSSTVVERHWRRWATTHQLDIDAILASSPGKRNLEVMAEFAPHLDVEREAAAMDAAEALDTDGILPYPAARELLSALPADRWGVATSGSIDTATTRLRTAGLPMPAVLITADQVQNGKPHPEPYLRAAEQLGIPPEHCLAFEDAASGVTAAKRAGMTVLAIASTMPREALQHADAILPTLADVSWQQQPAHDGTRGKAEFLFRVPTPPEDEGPVLHA